MIVNFSKMGLKEFETDKIFLGVGTVNKWIGREKFVVAFNDTNGVV